MAQVITAKLDELPGLIVRELRAVRGASLKALVRAGHLCKAEAVNAIRNVPTFNPAVPHAPVDTGELIRSYRVTPKGPERVRVENVAPHATFMELGTKPHTPPIKPLLEWALRKVRGRKRKATKRGTAQRPRRRRPKGQRPANTNPRRKIKVPAARLAEAKRLAWGTWAAIRRRGLEPRRFHAHASQKFPGIVRGELLRAYRKLKV